MVYVPLRALFLVLTIFKYGYECLNQMEQMNIVSCTLDKDI